jgi:hypothetical protein
MKTIRIKCPSGVEETLTTFADAHGLSLEIIESFGCPSFYAHLRCVATQDAVDKRDGIMIGILEGTGRTEDQAVKDLIKEMSGAHLVINSCGLERKDITCGFISA